MQIGTHHLAHAHATQGASAAGAAPPAPAAASPVASAASQPATIVRLSQAALSASHDADHDGDKK